MRDACSTGCIARGTRAPRRIDLPSSIRPGDSVQQDEANRKGRAGKGEKRATGARVEDLAVLKRDNKPRDKSRSRVISDRFTPPPPSKRDRDT